MRLLDAVKARGDATTARGRNRAALMAIQDEIEEVLAAGYTWQDAYEPLIEQGRIDMSYHTFRLHCIAMGLQTTPKSYTKETVPEDAIGVRKAAPKRASAKKKAAKRS